MDWIKFDRETCPMDKWILFWNSKAKSWFEGSLEDDSEYGLCIVVHSAYIGFENISHYLVVTEP